MRKILLAIATIAVLAATTAKASIISSITWATFFLALMLSWGVPARADMNPVINQDRGLSRMPWRSFA
jgi:hypothetical protein